MSRNLETEIATYQSMLPTLAKEQGRFAVIHGTALIGIFDTYNDALSAGYKTCKLEPFLVKQIQMIERVAFFTRNLQIECRA